MKVIFELKRNTRELRWEERKEIVEGCTVLSNCQDPETIKSFTSLDEALEELHLYNTDIYKLSGHGGLYFLVKEFFVEKTIYDEDGEWIEGGDIYEFSKISISLINDETGSSIGEFDSWEKAEKAYNVHEGECSLIY